MKTESEIRKEIKGIQKQLEDARKRGKTYSIDECLKCYKKALEWVLE